MSRRYPLFSSELVLGLLQSLVYVDYVILYIYIYPIIYLLRNAVLWTDGPAYDVWTEVRRASPFRDRVTTAQWRTLERANGRARERVF